MLLTFLLEIEVHAPNQLHPHVNQFALAKINSGSSLSNYYAHSNDAVMEDVDNLTN